jgi:hypothetical protein
LLRRAAGEAQYRVIQLGNDHFRSSIAELPDNGRNLADPKLLAVLGRLSPLISNALS